jgi:hypothetical protein
VRAAVGGSLGAAFGFVVSYRSGTPIPGWSLHVGAALIVGVIGAVLAQFRITA